MSVGNEIYELIEEPQDESSSFLSISLLFMLSLTFFIGYRLVQKAKAANHLEMEDGFGKVFVGFLLAWARFAHLDNRPLCHLPSLEQAVEDESHQEEVETQHDATLLANKNKKHAVVKAIGPHRTGMIDAIASVAKDAPGKIARFFATNVYNNTLPWGIVPAFFKLMNVIVVPWQADKKGKTGVIELGVNALKKGDSVALFPQGSFSLPNKGLSMIYSGAARMAIEANCPIEVIRLDGFWCLNTRLISQGIRDQAIFRSILSFFTVNNVSTTVCDVIKLHIREDGKQHSPEEVEQLIFEINAQLYAWYRNSAPLTQEGYKQIQREITRGYHLELWNNRKEQYQTSKNMKMANEKLSILKKEYDKLENPHPIAAASSPGL